jgi:hypothetical protein
VREATLYKEGSHITDVSVQCGGEIAVASGGVGGEYYLRIPADARADLLAALAPAAGQSLPAELTDEHSAELSIELFEVLFSRSNEDPYVDIQQFLKTSGVPFKSEYWPSR